MPLESKTVQLDAGISVLTVSWRSSCDAANGYEILAFTSIGVLPIHGINDVVSCDPIEIGKALGITRLPSSVPLAHLAREPWTLATCADSDGGTDVYFCTRFAVWKLSPDNNVSLVAGRASPPAAEEEPQGGRAPSEADGPGNVASFRDLTDIAVGNNETLFVVDGDCVRTLQLAPAGSAAHTAVSVTTTSFDATAVGYDRAKSLLYTAGYQGRSDTHCLSQFVDTPHLPQRLRQAKSVQVEAEAIPSVAVTDAGDVLAVNSVTFRYGFAAENPLLVMPAASGTIGTASSSRRVGLCSKILVLPGGGLVAFQALCGSNNLLFMSVDAKAYRVPGTVPPKPLDGRARLGSDLATFRSNPSAAPPDITVRVGGRAFPAHRLVLSSRCEYFARLFAGGFSDSVNPEMDLPDADPDAFDALLSYMYGGELRPTPALLRPLAELADRLILPEASAHLQQQLLAATSPATVVGDMLWAERHGLKQLLEGLKEYYLRNVPRLIEAAPEHVEELMSNGPELHLELHYQMVKRIRLR